MSGPVTKLNITSGVRIDLTDKIFQFMGPEVPFFSMVKKPGSSNGFSTQYQADKAGKISKAGRKDTHNYLAADAVGQSEDRATLESNLHKFGDTLSVGDTTGRVVVVAGVGKGRKIMANEIAKGLEAMVRSADQVLCDATDQKDETASVASETRGLFNWFGFGTQTVRPVPNTYKTPAAQRYTGKDELFSEAALKAICNSIFKHTGTSSRLVMLAGIDLKSAISDFANLAPNGVASACLRRNLKNQTEKTLESVVDVYKCDAGYIEIVPSNNLNRDRSESANASVSDQGSWSGLILDMKNHFVYIDQAPEYMSLPNNGAGELGRLQMIAKNCVGNPLVGGGVVCDLT